MKIAGHAVAPCPIPVKEEMIAWCGPVIYGRLRGPQS